MNEAVQFNRDPANSAGSRGDERPAASPGGPPAGDFTGLPVPELDPAAAERAAFEQGSPAPYTPPVVAPQGAASLVPAADPNAAVDAGIVPGAAAPATASVPRLEDVLGVEPDDGKSKRKSRKQRRKEQETAPDPQHASPAAFAAPAALDVPAAPPAPHAAAAEPFPASGDADMFAAPAPPQSAAPEWGAPAPETAGTPVVADPPLTDFAPPPAAPLAPPVAGDAPIVDPATPAGGPLSPGLDHPIPFGAEPEAPAPFGIEGTHPGSFAPDVSGAAPPAAPEFSLDEALAAPPVQDAPLAFEAPGQVPGFDAPAPDAQPFADPAFGAPAPEVVGEGSIVPATGMIPTPDLADPPSQVDGISSGFEMEAIAPGEVPAGLEGVAVGEAFHDNQGGAIPALEELPEEALPPVDGAIPGLGVPGDMPPPPPIPGDMPPPAPLMDGVMPPPPSGAPGFGGEAFPPAMPGAVAPGAPDLAMAASAPVVGGVGEEAWQQAGETALGFAGSDPSYGGYTPQAFEEAPPPPMPAEADPNQVEAELTTEAFSELSSLSATRPKVERTKTGLTKRQKVDEAPAPQPIDDGAIKPADRDADKIRSRYSSFYSGAARAKVDAAATEQNAHGDAGGPV